MANTILLKRSSTSGNAPTIFELGYGELALNYADNKLYFKNSSDEIRIIEAYLNKLITVSTTSLTSIDSFSYTSYRSAKYIIQMSQGSDYQVSEVLLIHNNSSVFLTEYGVVETNSSLGTLSADINNGNVRLLVTMNSSTNCEIHIHRIAL